MRGRRWGMPLAIAVAGLFLCAAAGKKSKLASQPDVGQLFSSLSSSDDEESRTAKRVLDGRSPLLGVHAVEARTRLQDLLEGERTADDVAALARYTHRLVRCPAPPHPENPRRWGARHAGSG